MKEQTLSSPRVVGGTFTLHEDSIITEPIPFDASLDEINAALERAHMKTRIVADTDSSDA